MYHEQVQRSESLGAASAALPWMSCHAVAATQAAGCQAGIELPTCLQGGVAFHDTRDKLLPRPWVVDCLDALVAALSGGRTYRQAVMFVDNCGCVVGCVGGRAAGSALWPHGSAIMSQLSTLNPLGGALWPLLAHRQAYLLGLQGRHCAGDAALGAGAGQTGHSSHPGSQCTAQHQRHDSLRAGGAPASDRWALLLIGHASVCMRAA